MRSDNGKLCTASLKCPVTFAKVFVMCFDIISISFHNGGSLVLRRGTIQNPYPEFHNNFTPKPSFKKPLIFQLDNFFMACHSQIIISVCRIALLLCAYGFGKLLSQCESRDHSALTFWYDVLLWLTLHNPINHKGEIWQVRRFKNGKALNRVRFLVFHLMLILNHCRPKVNTVSEILDWFKVTLLPKKIGILAHTRFWP